MVIWIFLLFSNDLCHNQTVKGLTFQLFHEHFRNKEIHDNSKDFYFTFLRQEKDNRNEKNKNKDCSSVAEFIQNIDTSILKSI